MDLAYLVLKVVKSGLGVHEKEELLREVSFEMSKEVLVKVVSPSGSKV